MNFLRTTGVFLFGLLCTASLSLLGSTLVFNATIAHPQTVKHWLSESGTYENALSTLYGTVDTTNSTGRSKLVAATDDAVQKAIADSFSPAYLRTQTEAALDATYPWLQGTSPSVTFSIHTQEQRPVFVKSVTNSLTAYFASLPVCAPRQQPQSDTGELACRPVSLSPESLAAQSANEIAAQLPILASPITPASFVPQASGGGSIATRTRNVPLVWQLLQNGPAIAVAGIIVGLGGIAVVSKDRLRSLSRLLRTVAFSALLSVVLFGAALWASTRLPLQSLAKDGAPPEFVIALVRIITMEIATLLAIFYGCVLIVSIVGWLVIRRSLRRHVTIDPLATGPVIAAETVVAKSNDIV